MVNGSKATGTRFESACVKWLRENGFPRATRQPLHGAVDSGDLTLDPMGAVIAECKAGKAAHTASDAQVAAWLAETEAERVAAAADVGLLIVDRLRQPVHRSWAVMRSTTVAYLHGGVVRYGHEDAVVRMTLADAADLLAGYGYGGAS